MGNKASNQDSIETSRFGSDLSQFILFGQTLASQSPVIIVYKVKTSQAFDAMTQTDFPLQRDDTCCDHGPLLNLPPLGTTGFKWQGCLRLQSGPGIQEQHCMVGGRPEGAVVRAFPFLAGHRGVRPAKPSTCSGGGPLLSAFATIFRLIASSSASLVLRLSVPSSSDNRRRPDGAGPCRQVPSSRSAPRLRIEAWERRSRSLEPSTGVRGVKFAISSPSFRTVSAFPRHA